MPCWHRRDNYGTEQPSESPTEYLQKLCRDIMTDGDKDKLRERLTANELMDSEDFEYDMANMIDEGEMPGDFVKDVINRRCFMKSLYAYEHSGITIRTSSFSDPWDSGQLGLIVIKLENLKDILEEKDCHIGAFVDPEIVKKLDEVVESWVKTYDSYLRGEVYRFSITRTEKKMYEDFEHGELPCHRESHEEDVDSCGGFLGEISGNGILEAISETSSELAELLKDA
jgi:hypothetical protein